MEDQCREMKKDLSFEISESLRQLPRYLWSTSIEKCFLSIVGDLWVVSGYLVMVNRSLISACGRRWMEGGDCGRVGGRSGETHGERKNPLL